MQVTIDDDMVLEYVERLCRKAMDEEDAVYDDLFGEITRRSLVQARDDHKIARQEYPDPGEDMTVDDELTKAYGLVIQQFTVPHEVGS